MSRTRFAVNGDVRIAYEVRGAMHARRPVLLLVQGLGFDRTGWGPAVQILQRWFRLVLVDNRGTGSSGPAGSAFSVTDMRRDVLAVLDDVGVGAAHIAGASLGGMVAQDLAIAHPERVDRLVLACTTPGWPFAYPMPAPFLRLVASSRRLGDGAASRRLIEAALSAETAAASPELVDRILARLRSAGEQPGIWRAQAKAGARYSGHFRQGRIRARTLILHGAADNVVDPRNARLLAHRISGSDLVMLPGRGHLLYWEDPSGFASAVAGFLLDRAAQGGAR